MRESEHTMTDDRPTLNDLYADLESRAFDIDDPRLRTAIDTLVDLGYLDVEPPEPLRIGAIVETKRRNTDRFGVGSTYWTRWTSNAHSHGADASPWVSAQDGAHAMWYEVLSYGVTKVVHPGLTR